MIASGTGGGSVQEPLYWVFGFVMYSAAGSPAQVVEPARMPRQYCVWTAWNELPPTPCMKELR